MPLLKKRILKAPMYSTSGVYVQEVPSGVRVITAASTSTTVMIGAAMRGPLNKAVEIRSFPEFKKNFGELQSRAELGYAAMQFFVNGGTSLIVVRTAQTLDAARLSKALKALEEVKDFGLLLVPGLTDARLLSSVLAYARKRLAFVVIDAPQNLKTPDAARLAIKQNKIPETADGALYLPWLWIADPQNAGKLRLSAPGGSIAGVIARTDQTRGVWKSPAGLEAVLKGVKAPAVEVPAADQEVFNPLGLNGIRLLNGNALTVWGARTLQEVRGTRGEYRYLAVRRLSLLIEKSLTQGLSWVVFEPNDEPLWAQIRSSVESFFQTLFRSGAFQGASAREAYFVRCDRSTMTSRDIISGLIHVQTGFAPLKPAEFIVLSMTFKSA